MTDKEKASVSYRFSGYQLPKITLSDPGFVYYNILGVHPYYTTQPTYWQKPYFTTSTPALGNSRNIIPTGPLTSDSFPPTQVSDNKLHCMAKF